MLGAALALTAPGAAAPGCALAASQVPGFAHVVVIVEENHSADSVLGNTAAPFINSLAAGGALMTRSYAVGHPSQPNYLALFAGDTFGVDSDACPLNLGDAPNLASELLAAGHTFGGFSEGLPAAGSPGMQSGRLRAQARALGELHQRPGERLTTIGRLHR